MPTGRTVRPCRGPNSTSVPVLPQPIRAVRDSLLGLQCQICEEAFGLEGDKVPRLLHCGHSVCHACLTHIPVQEDCIQCPFDRQPTIVGHLGVKGLNKNFSLLEVLERLHISEKSCVAQLPGSETLETARKRTVPCDEDKQHVAVLYCTVCSSHLCKACSELTHSTKTLLIHRMVKLSEKRRERPKCPSHQSYPAEYICLERDCQVLESNNSRLMCFKCMIYGRHRTHKFGLVEVEAARIRSSVLDHFGHACIVVQQMKYIMRRIDSAVQRLEDDEPSRSEERGGTPSLAREKVQAYFQTLRKTLDDNETKALEAIDSHVQKRLCCLKQFKDDVRQCQTEVICAVVVCKHITDEGDGDVLVAARVIENYLLSIKKHHQQLTNLFPEELDPEPSFTITFTKENQVVHIGSNINVVVALLGLNGAGKTSILNTLTLNEFGVEAPTNDFGAEAPTNDYNVRLIKYRKLSLTVWEAGGQRKLLYTWNKFYNIFEAILFVIDSSSPERFHDVRRVLTNLMTDKKLDIPFLFLANKQDLPGSESIENIIEQLTLSKLCCGRSWHIQACDAKTGSGLHDGLDWLSLQWSASCVIDVG